MLQPLYFGRDPAHGLGHIERIHSKSLSFAKKYKVDGIALSLGAVLHGLVKRKRTKAERILKNNDINNDLIKKGICIALESQADAIPKSMEGKILHDAHLCEGTDFFIVAKCLATATSNGYPLKETYGWVKKNIIANRKRRCYLPEGKQDYTQKIKITKLVWNELARICE